MNFSFLVFPFSLLFVSLFPRKRLNKSKMTKMEKQTERWGSKVGAMVSPPTTGTWVRCWARTWAVIGRRTHWSRASGLGDWVTTPDLPFAFAHDVKSYAKTQENREYFWQPLILICKDNTGKKDKPKPKQSDSWVCTLIENEDSGFLL